jgi:hypothetical protein
MITEDERNKAAESYNRSLLRIPRKYWGAYAQGLYQALSGTMTGNRDPRWLRQRNQVQAALGRAFQQVHQ